MSNPAETYEDFMVPAMFQPLIPHMIEVAGPQPGERVLDVACGTGIVARRIAGHLDNDAQVVGADLSPMMLGVARARAEADDVTVEWHECRAESLPFPDRAFDLVTCQHGLQFVPEPSEALAEMYRVLDENGRAVTVTWRSLDQHPFYAELDAAFVRHVGSDAGADPFSLGDTERLTGLFTGAGFTDVEIHPTSFTASYSDPEFAVSLILRGATAAVPALREISADGLHGLIEAVQDDMTAIIEDHRAGDRLEVPMQAIATLGRKLAT